MIKDMESYLQDLHARRKLGAGTEKDVATQHGKHRLTARERINLLFDPGTKWEYGTNVDWVGQVIEGITGKRLGEVFQTRIFDPLGITGMTFEINDAIRSRLATMHARLGDGELEPMAFELPSNPEVHFGGHGLYGTVGDYMKFIRMWLNDGAGPNGRVLKPETVEMALRRHLAACRCAGFL